MKENQVFQVKGFIAFHVWKMKESGLAKIIPFLCTLAICVSCVFYILSSLGAHWVGMAVASWLLIAGILLSALEGWNLR